MSSTDDALARGSAAGLRWTLASRITGFARIVAVGAVLGPTYLGAVSDLLRDTHPTNSLQIAFYTLVPFYALAVVMFLILARRLKRETGDNL